MTDRIQAQDPVYSQFYGNPIYLNPALAGTNECSRIIANYRNQWPSLPGNFVDYSVSFDSYIDQLSGGVGVLVTSQNIANSTFVTNRASLIYSYNLTLGIKSELRAGFEATFHHQTFNWDKLVFADMIDENSGYISSATGETAPEKNSTIAPDFSGGLLFGHDQKYYAGIAVHHMTQPDLSFYSSGSNPLFRKYTVHMGANIVLHERSIGHRYHTIMLSPNILYQRQNNTNQINGGFYIERMPIVAGLWYRHNIENDDAIILLLGIKQKRFNIGYSYDLTLSKLKNATGGAHEVSLGLLIFCEKRNRKGAIKCPEF